MPNALIEQKMVLFQCIFCAQTQTMPMKLPFSESDKKDRKENKERRGEA